MLCVLAALAADCPANPIAHSPCPVCPAEDEKQYIRNATMAILVGDPSDRVALQVGCTAIYCHVLQCSWLPDAAACCCRLMPPPCTAVAPARSCGGRLAPPPPRASPLCCAAAPVLQVTLLITNIARFDAPQPWQQLLPDLLAAAAEDSAVPPAGKQRALTALKHVLQALKGGCLAAGVLPPVVWVAASSRHCPFPSASTPHPQRSFCRHSLCACRQEVRHLSTQGLAPPVRAG